MRKNAKNNKKGFTLIELIVVVAILVALMLMLVPKLTGFTNDAKKTANEANARAIYTAIIASQTAEKTGMYPARTDATAKTATVCGVKVYTAFWEDGDISGCVATPETGSTDIASVTYPNDTDPNKGTYPKGTYDPTDDKKD